MSKKKKETKKVKKEEFKFGFSPKQPTVMKNVDGHPRSMGWASIERSYDQ